MKTLFLTLAAFLLSTPAGADTPAPRSVKSEQIGAWTVGRTWNLTAANDSVTVAGTVAISNLPAVKPVSQSGTWSVGRTWALTSADQVSIANFPATQTIAGSVAVSNFPSSQAVTAASLPLPAGAATAAKQPAIGTAASPSADVLTVQGVAGGVPQPVTVGNFPGTQAVSAAALPLPTGAATAALQSPANSSLASLDSKLPAQASGKLPVDGSGVTQPVSAAALPLPSGAATSALQNTGNGSLGSIDVKTPVLVGGRVPVDGSGVTQPVSAAALPLPSGAATSAAQTAGNASLADMNSKTPALVNGASPVAVASLPLPAGASTEATLAAVNGKLPSGLSVTNARLWVDPSGVTQPVSAAALPLPAGAATETTLGAVNTGTTAVNTSVSGMSAKIPMGLTVQSNRLAVDGSGVTQPISATVLPLPTNAATVGNQIAELNMLGQIQAAQGVPQDGAKNTYSASISLLAPAASPTDVLTLYGSASKTIRVTRVALTGTLTTAAQRDVLLIRRSTANSGGTAMGAFAHDTMNGAATASAKYYTANPTLGTTVGIVRTRKVYFGTATSNSDEMIMEFGNRPAQAIVLRGTGEGLAVNLNGVTASGASLDISIEWTEE